MRCRGIGEALPRKHGPCRQEVDAQNHFISGIMQKRLNLEPSLNCRHMRKKWVAALLALLLGWLGAHRYYLGRRGTGILMTALGVLGLIHAYDAPFDPPVFLLVAALWAMLDFVLLLAMPTEAFDARYNGKYDRREDRYFARYRRDMARRYGLGDSSEVDPEFENWKRLGIEAFKEYELEKAREAFKNALRIYPDDPAVHFNLACTYSLLEKPYPAMFHLAKAVENGFVDLDKIETHEALAFLRTHPDFEAFQRRGYRYADPEAGAPRALESPAETPDLLEQLRMLDSLRRRGLLTEAEYEAERRRIERMR